MYQEVLYILFVLDIWKMIVSIFISETVYARYLLFQPFCSPGPNKLYKMAW
jgi:hypothetical protein